MCVCAMELSGECPRHIVADYTAILRRRWTEKTLENSDGISGRVIDSHR